MAVDRRSLFTILGAGLAASGDAGAQHQHSQPATSASVPYAARALTAAEYQVVDTLADIIFPPDETSPGAHDAGVARYIDIVLLYSDKSVLASWQDGVKSVNKAAGESHGKPFHDLAREQQIGIVRKMAASEGNPGTELERFFETVKRLSFEAYYLSSAGRQSLGYKGDTAIAEFAGCREPEHQTGRR